MFGMHPLCSSSISSFPFLANSTFPSKQILGFIRSNKTNAKKPRKQPMNLNLSLVFFKFQCFLPAIVGKPIEMLSPKEFGQFWQNHGGNRSKSGDCRSQNRIWVESMPEPVTTVTRTAVHGGHPNELLAGLKI
jgi:hypothetical protein